jgi:hypothetical protein
MRTATTRILAEIRGGVGESSYLELKETLDLQKTESKAEFIRDVIALANAVTPRYKGPKALVIGIDNAGKVKGIRHNEFDGANLRQIISAFVSPEVVNEYQEIGIRKKRVGMLFLFPDPSKLYVVCKKLSSANQKEVLLTPLQSWERLSSGKRLIDGKRFAERFDACVALATSAATSELRAELDRLQYLSRFHAPLAEIRNLRYEIDETDKPDIKGAALPATHCLHSRVRSQHCQD